MPLENPDETHSRTLVHTVKKSERIDSFLMNILKVPLYKVNILLTCVGVTVSTAGSYPLRLLKDGQEMVTEGDEVFIDEPLPDVFKSFSSLVQPSDYNDYVLVPPGYPEISQYFRDRPNSSEIKPPPNSLSDFFNSLKDPAKKVRPIRDLIIVAHGNPKGALKLALTSKSKVKEILYPDLQEAVSTGVIFIEETLVMPRPPSTGCAPATLNIKSCNIGQAPKFMKELKKAIGGKITVTAPKYFDQYWHIPSRGSVGYMDYSFSFAVPPIQNDPQHKKPLFSLPFKSRDEVIKAFASKGFKLYNDEPVPNKYWPQWIKSGVWNQSQKWPEKFFLDVTNDTLNLPLPVEFRCKRVEYSSSDLFDKKDMSHEERKKALSEIIISEDKSFSGDYPQYEWYGYSSMQEFMDGWEWIFELGAKSDDQWKVYSRGFRYEYMVKRPIVDPPNTNKLIVNFYPNKSASKKFPQVTLLEKGDSKGLFDKFFTTV